MKAKENVKEMEICKLEYVPWFLYLVLEKVKWFLTVLDDSGLLEGILWESEFHKAAHVLEDSSLDFKLGYDVVSFLGYFAFEEHWVFG